MRIVTNPGSNLGKTPVRHYGIHLTAQQIVVDGEAHDTREGCTNLDVDRWVRDAREFPHVVGTTAPEFVSVFAALLKDDPEIVAVLTSRQLIKSFAAAETASRTLHDTARHKRARISVVDTGLTDVGAGLVAIAIAEASRAGVPMEAAVELGRAFAARAKMVWVLDSLEYARKGGRAGWLRSWLASVLEVKPLVAFVDGELKSIARIPAKEDAASAIAQNLAKSLGAGRRVWIGVFHGHAPEKADRLVAELSSRFDVAYAWKRALCPSIYLHCGPGTVGAAVFPLDGLSHEIPIPPVFPDER